MKRNGQISLKLGNMRKPQDFTIYPINTGDTRFNLQSDHRCVQVDMETGKGMLSKQVPNYPTFYHCAAQFGGMAVQLTPDELQELKLTAIGKGETIDMGGGVMIADNSGISGIKF